MIADSLRLVLPNVTLTFFVLGLIGAAISLLRAPGLLTAAVPVHARGRARERAGPACLRGLGHVPQRPVQR